MMNKIFVGLFILTIAGAGILFWLMKSLPNSAGLNAQDPTKPLTEVQSTPDGGVTVTEKGDEKIAEGTAVHGEEPIKGETSHADAKAESELKALDAQKNKTKAPRLNISTTPVPGIVFVDGTVTGQTPVSIELQKNSQTVKIEAAGYEDVLKDAPTLKEASDVENLNWRITLKESSKKSHEAKPEAGKVESHKLKNEESPVGGAHAAKDAKPVVSGSHKAPKVVPVAATHEAVVPLKGSPNDKATPALPVALVHDKDEKAPPAKVAEPVKTPAPAKILPAESDDDYMIHGRAGPVWLQVKAFSPGESGAVKGFVQSLKSKTKDPVIACQVNLKAKGKWTRVLIGPYDNKVDAKVSLESIKKGVAQEAFVTGVQQCL